MEIEKKKPSVPRLDEELKNNHETNGKEMNRTVKEIIEKNRKILRKK